MVSETYSRCFCANSTFIDKCIGAMQVAKIKQMERQMDLEEILACPKCGSKLRISTLAWTCRKCGKEWPINMDGIVRLLDSGQFFGSDQEAIVKLLEEMRDMSAEEFFNNIERFEKEYRDFDYDYCLNPARADWTILGDFHDKIVVDLGCAYGAVSQSLTARAKIMIGVDNTLERLEFFSLVAGFRQIKNIVPIYGDVFDLPFKEGVIDIFVCIGLLEYAATFKQGVRPIDIQREFLEHLCRHLSERGEIWIGIENRLNPMYLVGKTHHGDLPFTPLMPRIVANAVHRIFKGEPYKIWTHSQRAYRKLLQTVGFETVEFYYPFPNYQRPRFIVPPKQRKVFRYMSKNPGFGSNSSIRHKMAIRVYKMLEWMGLLGVFAPAFLIRAVKVS